MILTRYLAWSVAAAISLAAPLRAAEGHPPASFALSLASPEGLVPRGVEVTAQTYLGRKAVRVVESAAPPAVEQAIALLREPRFQDGTIDVDVAGKPRPGSDPGARGFVGIAFRSAANASAFECIYIGRPTAAPVISSAAITRRNTFPIPSTTSRDSARSLRASTSLMSISRRAPGLTCGSRWPGRQPFSSSTDRPAGPRRERLEARRLRRSARPLDRRRDGGVLLDFRVRIKK